MKLIAAIPTGLQDLKELFENCNPANNSSCPVTKTGGLKFESLSDLLTNSLNIIITIAAFLTFFWLVWAAFQYITAGGDKQKLSQARSRIIWAVVGLLMVAIAFLVAQFTARLLPSSSIVPIL